MTFKLVENMWGAFFFDYKEFEIEIDFRGCENDVYHYHQNKKITANPLNSHPDVDECYLTTHEHVVVCYFVNESQVKEADFAEKLGVSAEELNSIVEKLTEEAEGLFIESWYDSNSSRYDDRNY